jgi:hypothetical protein
MPSRIVRRLLRIPFVLYALVAVLAVAATPAARAIEDNVPPDVRRGIEDVLRKKAAELLSQKDKNGVSTKRGTYSRSFRKIDDSTYAATFHIDTVEPSPDDSKTDRLRTERYELTLKGFAGTPWKIAKEDLKESSASLYRGWFGGGEIYKFDKLAFEREGLKLSATNGYLWMVSRQGKPQGLTLYADDLTYAYTPPADTGYYGLIKSRIVKEHTDDLIFKPERLEMSCDAASCAELFPAIFTGLTKIDAGAAGGASSGVAQNFRNAFDTELKDVEKNRKDNPFSGFWLMPEEDRRYWTVRIKRAGARDHYLTLNYDNWEPWEVRAYATGFGAFNFFGPYGPIWGQPLFAYYSQDVRKSSIPPIDLERRDDSDSRDYEIDSIKGAVDIALDEALELNGDVTYGLTTKREVAFLPFAIARANVSDDVQDAKNPRLFVNSIQDGAGNELTWVKRGGYDGLVIFPKPVPVGTKMTLRMRFTSLDSIRKVNPSFTAMDRGGWLPFVRFADFIDTFDLTVRTPERFTVLGIGRKVSDEAANGIRTTRWTAEKPVSFPTIIFGDYLSAVSDHIVKKSDGTPIPVTVYVDKVSTNALDTRILDTKGNQGTQAELDEMRAAGASGARDIRGKQLGPIAVQAAVAIELYQKIYGVDYPYAKLDLVADPLGSFYGQAPSSIIYLGFGVFRGEGTVAAGGMFGGGANIAKFNKDVVAHETGHQWWGSVICNANQRNYWFVETLAELSSALYVEKVFGRKKYDEKVAEWRDNVMKFDQVTSVQNNYTVWGGEDGFRSVQSNIYNKGPYAFHVFRMTFGDEKFFALLKELAQELQHKEIVTRDIQDVMEKVVGGNMDWFFDQWIRGIGKPQYALNYTTRKNEQGKWIVEGTIKQRVVYGKYRDAMPGVFYRGVAPLTFVSPDGKEVKSAKPLLVQGPETPFRVIVADEPAQVFFNKDGEILAEDTLINRSW